MSERTDPATCLHNVIHLGRPDAKDNYYWCVSCGSVITQEMWESHNYQFDGDLAVFVHIDESAEAKRARRLERAVVQYGVEYKKSLGLSEQPSGKDEFEKFIEKYKVDGFTVGHLVDEPERSRDPKE